jgi:hypothetical protein
VLNSSRVGYERALRVQKGKGRSCCARPALFRAYEVGEGLLQPRVMVLC